MKAQMVITVLIHYISIKEISNSNETPEDELSSFTSHKLCKHTKYTYARTPAKRLDITNLSIL